MATEDSEIFDPLGAYFDLFEKLEIELGPTLEFKRRKGRWLIEVNVFHPRSFEPAEAFFRSKINKFDCLEIVSVQNLNRSSAGSK